MFSSTPISQNLSIASKAAKTSLKEAVSDLHKELKTNGADWAIAQLRSCEILQITLNNSNLSSEEIYKKFSNIESLSLPKKIKDKITFFCHLYQASTGNAKAYLSIAQAYQLGEGVEGDPHKAKYYYLLAFNFYTKESAQGNYEAWYILGGLYLRGLGVNKDLRAAKKWFANFKYYYQYENTYKSKTQPNPDQLTPQDQYRNLFRYELAKIYLVEKNYALAIKELEEAEKMAHIESKILLGQIYYEGVATQKNLVKAKEKLLEAFAFEIMHFKEKEMIPTQVHSKISLLLTLGQIFEEEENYKQALTYYEIASQIASSDIATLRLGYFYSLGLGVNVDIAKAHQYFSWAAEQGNPEAILMQAEEALLSADYQKAMKHYQDAMSLSCAEATYQLGRIYELGLGIAPNSKEAKIHYELSAGRGWADASLQLARLEEGNNLRRSTDLYKLAYQQFKEIISEPRPSYLQHKHEQHLANAYFQTAWIEHHGKGTAVNLESAMKNYEKAHELNYPSVQSQIDLVKQLKKSAYKNKEKSKQQIKTDGSLKQNEGNNKKNNSQQNFQKNTKKEKNVRECFEEVYSFIQQKQFDHAIQLIHQIEKMKEANENNIIKAKCLWAIASCLKEKYQNNSSEKKKIISAYDEAIAFITENLEKTENYLPAHSELKSIKNFIEFDLNELNPQPLKPKLQINQIEIHEHEPQQQASQADSLAPSHPTSSSKKKKAKKHKKPLTKATETIEISAADAHKSEEVVKTKSVESKEKIPSKQPIEFPIHIPLTQNGIYVRKKLLEKASIVYLHGGWVRDHYLILKKGKNVKIHDLDMITNITPDEIITLFPGRSEIVGKRFPIVRITCDDGEVIEVSTFRKKSLENTANYQVNEKTGLIEKSQIFGSVETDHELRDFKYNSLYYDPDKKVILDYVGGLEDLDAELTQFVIDPKKSIAEDPLRILRGIYYTAKLNFKIPQKTQEAISQSAYLLPQVHRSRIYSATTNLFQPFSGYEAFKSMIALNVLPYVLPSVAKYLTFCQDEVHLEMIKILLEGNQSANPDAISTHYDLILAVLLWGPLQYNLWRMRNIEAAIFHTLHELTYTISLPFELKILESIQHIFFLLLSPRDSHPIQHAHPNVKKADFILNLGEQANEKVASYHFKNIHPSWQPFALNQLSQFHMWNQSKSVAPLPKESIHLRKEPVYF